MGRRAIGMGSMTMRLGTPTVKRNCHAWVLHRFSAGLLKRSKRIIDRPTDSVDGSKSLEHHAEGGLLFGDGTRLSLDLKVYGSPRIEDAGDVWVPYWRAAHNAATLSDCSDGVDAPEPYVAK